jgi:hypothetical protein
MRRRECLSAPEPLDAILCRAGESRFARVHSAIPPRVWRDAVGARIAEHAHPLSLSGETLLLRVPSSVWAHELSLLAEAVCGRLHQCGIIARALRFRVGPLPSVERPPERRSVRSMPVDRVIPPNLARALDRLGDSPLRNAISRAAAANLAWQALTASGREVGDPSATMRAARAPRCAEEETCPQDPTPPVSRGHGRRTPEGEPSRSR